MLVSMKQLKMVHFPFLMCVDYKKTSLGALIFIVQGSPLGFDPVFLSHQTKYMYKLNN